MDTLGNGLGSPAGDDEEELARDEQGDEPCRKVQYDGMGLRGIDCKTPTRITNQHSLFSLSLSPSLQPPSGFNTRARVLSVTHSLSRRPTSVTNTHGQRKLGSQKWMDTRRLTMGSAGGKGERESVVS